MSDPSQLKLERQVGISQRVRPFGAMLQQPCLPSRVESVSVVGECRLLARRNESILRFGKSETHPELYEASVMVGSVAIVEVDIASR